MRCHILRGLSCSISRVTAVGVSNLQTVPVVLNEDVATKLDISLFHEKSASDPTALGLHFGLLWKGN